MTRKEAIEELNWMRDEVWNEDSDGYEYAKAIDMAIDSLEHLNNIEAYMHDFDVTEEEATKALERKRGEWIIQDGNVICSECFEPNLENKLLS